MRSNVTRNVALRCPTCGNDQFAFDDMETTVQCAGCHRELSRDELLNENRETIREGVKALAKDVLQEALPEMRASLKNAFQGSKHISSR